MASPVPRRAFYIDKSFEDDKLLHSDRSVLLKVHDVSDHTPYILKRCPSDHHVGLHETEIKIMQHLAVSGPQDAHLVPCLEQDVIVVQDDPSTPVERNFIMPFYKGGDLFFWIANYLRTGQGYNRAKDANAPKRFLLPMAVLKGIFIQVLELVHACHTAGVLHHDLKLEQFVIDDVSGHLYLSDFETAWFANDKTPEVLSSSYPLTSTQAMSLGVMTLGYRSPEMVYVSEWVTQSYFKPRLRQEFSSEWRRILQSHVTSTYGDYFSLGIILFSLYMGAPPFEKVSIQDRCYKSFLMYPDAYWKHLNTIHRKDNELDMELKKIVDGLLYHEYNLRWGYEEVCESAFYQDCMKHKSEYLEASYKVLKRTKETEQVHEAVVCQ